MGHALTMTLQDTLIRWRRMQGPRRPLAAPAPTTPASRPQMVVERLLPTETSQTRQQMGRDKFLERVSGNGRPRAAAPSPTSSASSAPRSTGPRERFTMDDGLNAAVREVFVTLHQQGLIYRDRRLVNWDPKFQSAISDLEVESLEVNGSLWYFRYPVEGTDQLITVATTRPETMLGDTAVAVHPDDPRFAHLVGRMVLQPLTGRRFPIVADTYSDPEKGTGAVKITPAHDFIRLRGRPPPQPAHALRAGPRGPYHAGRTHPPIRRQLRPQPRRHGTASPPARRSSPRWTAWSCWKRPNRTATPSPTATRSGVPIEPLLTVQWYCNAAELAKPAIAAVETGATVFVPKQWENTFFAWMRDIQPWCISRQLWWGHRIPAWYGPDGTVFVAPRRHPPPPPRPSHTTATPAISPRTRTSSTPGSAAPSGPSAPSAGRNKPPNSPATTLATCSSPASTSSSSGSPA